MITYILNKANLRDINCHLLSCDNSFKPPLRFRLNIKEFSNKIFENAITFEAWDNEKLVGLVSGYFNNTTDKIAFINNVSVLSEYMGKGIATSLLRRVICYGQEIKFKEIGLEVAEDNHRAIELYKKEGFTEFDRKEKFIIMKYHLSQ